ncbi:ribosome small subunit-dependent GTPase A [Tepidibacter formicigenes]|jgi:ribosome biogenesis GTPase|uniref:Small ribosomal subunit biogenesis GTPase RsgA n=1 Tax=Tepidibacter formicigenes DSM 15518 TaxID=1123349 RepID=A0A1M6KHJ6_9FIRM|nr:ribosome small subunit-dependent GTPase A [Tepidibacter formicigenes]SHJ58409.1 ribosome biogenesis GTPase [Tepidibacter formicigenes DSM 15518]
MLKGRILKGIGGFYYVDTDEGIFECKARGIFRKKRITPLVGDLVRINIIKEDEKKGVIEKIEKRSSELIRPPIANITKAIIVFSIKNPNPHLSLLDRFIVLAEKEGLEIVIAISKIDLDEDNDFEKIKCIYEKAGYKVIPISIKKDINIEKIKEELNDNTVVFAGPSGVGKSSLLNSIDSNLKLETGSVSEKIKRGKHTTRHAELLKLDFGGMVADTPGFSSLNLDDIEEQELKDYFIEFENYSNDCKFYRNCLHENEPNCGVKDALEKDKISKERYKSYLQLLKEIRKNNRRY